MLMMELPGWWKSGSPERGFLDIVKEDKDAKDRVK